MSVQAVGVTGYQDFSRVQNRKMRPEVDNEYAKKKAEAEKGAPYSFMADDNGFICYHGVTFYCDNENQVLSLGDVSDPDQVLTIPLEDGGCLKVNRANIGDLSHAITMFTPGDIKRILSAIAEDTHCVRKINEIGETQDEAVEQIASGTSGEEEPDAV